MFFVGLVRLFVCQQDYIQSNERIYIKLSPEKCLRPRNNPLHFWDDAGYDQHPDRAGGD